MALAVLASVGACTTPTFPLPPPDPEKVTFGLSPTAGTTTFSYAADADYANRAIRAIVFDDATGYGVVVPAGADGSVPETPPFAAVEGDEILIYMQLDEESKGICLILHNGPSGAINYCP